MKLQSCTTSPRRIALLASAALLLVLVLPAVASAGCGGVHTESTTRAWTDGQRAPLAVGDSTMLLAIHHLARHGFDVNARGCRGYEEGLRLLLALKRKDKLPHMVVMSLGTDWSVSRAQLARTRKLLGPERELVLVTPYELGGYAGRDAAMMRLWVRINPTNAVLLDWVAHARKSSRWFQPDGAHLTFEGARAYAAFLATALTRAMPPVPPPAAQVEVPR